jgi:putative hydrolase of the HAD superfamily
MVIIFDLDDTLYEELSFVRSGLAAVADFLSTICQRPSAAIYQGLLAQLAVARPQLFDRYLSTIGKKSSALVRKCVSIYRHHTPDIALYPEARACLLRLRKYPLYVVTDGNHRVQRRKFEALQLGDYVKKGYFTYAHGKEKSKPSPYCFEKIAHCEHQPFHRIVYVADNPHKDFVGLKPLNFHTIRVQTGPYKSLAVPPEYDAEISIPSLEALTEELLSRWTAATQFP